MNTKIDNERRKFLIVATSVVGGVGLIGGSIPFVGSLFPSAQAKALGAPVDLDLKKIGIGQKVTVSWRGQPIFVIHRPDSLLASLSLNESKLRDPLSDHSEQPTYVKNIYRSINKNFFVVVGICTHLGCVPLYKPNVGSLEPSWKGGFFCPCHGSKFDISGRVFKGVPAPINLPIPPYRYLNDSTIRIGENDKI
ncbi:MAG: ubiquinol-cytochrome c reductase iron-sulfur subunit [Candidatus Azosocius agrarius]|nr:MAG: ubiquinol-cytochrome c reductase iron-sulfur subunit [Gammaproteobacteria bacterium]